jgi:predicted nucleic acid-binding protein
MAELPPNSGASAGQSAKNDMMIAAIALALGNCTVVTMDTDLSAVPGLTVENWAA